MSKFSNWLLAHEPAFINGITVAVTIGKAVLGFNPKDGKSIQDLINAVVPQGKSWTAEVTKIALDLAADAVVVSNPISRKGIVLRLGAEILSIIDGGKLPTGIDGYISEIQSVFVG